MIMRAFTKALTKAICDCFRKKKNYNEVEEPRRDKIAMVFRGKFKFEP